MPETDTLERVKIIRRLIKLLMQLIALKRKTKSRQHLLYERARLYIGRDASPLDLVNDDLGCAESVSQIISKIVPFPIITGTWTLNDRLAGDLKFQRVNENAGPGTIIISPTGTGNGKIRGHVGILGPDKTIMANDSALGLWRQSYTVESWRQRFQTMGGFPVYFYRLD